MKLYKGEKMKSVAKFEKVSFDQFKGSMIAIFDISDEDVQEAYDNIVLPSRATIDSAGYDFRCPISVDLAPGETLLIPTGIRCDMNSGYALMLYPRSSLGFKYGMRLLNTVGIIDADYYFADNEGHIMIKVVCDKSIHIEANDRIAQGVFTKYYITFDDKATKLRTGGFGSTGN